VVEKGDIAVLEAIINRGKETWVKKDPGREDWESDSRLATEDGETGIGEGKRVLLASCDVEDEGILGGMDFEDNLTYREDSLSVMRGEVTTPLGKDVPVWVTTDSGSMTQLMQASYARKLKLKIKTLPDKEWFFISSPGGGREDITEYADLALKIKVKKESSPEQRYEANENEEGYRTIRMTYGLCESLPVPILWGGRQMRDWGLLDYHGNRVLSIKMEENERVMTKSTSWLVATAEMAQIKTKAIRKVYKEYIPTADRMSNMVRGEREAINMQAVLYPKKDNVVRIGRHNCRVDEGYNEIALLNNEEVEREYGGRLLVIDSVGQGESFIIVRNLSTQALSLPAGTLKVAVRPAVCIPRVMGAHMEDEETGERPQDRYLRRNHHASHVLGVGEKSELTNGKVPGPLKFYSWNVNGLGNRVKKQELEKRFFTQIEREGPSIIALQEVRLTGEPGAPTKVKVGTKDEDRWRTFMRPLEKRYHAYLNLSDHKYGGQVILVDKTIRQPKISYNMRGKAGHYEDGRFMRLDFEDITVRTVYAPFNGVGREDQLARRKRWDAQLREEMREDGHQGKPSVLMGDLNVVFHDTDMSPHPQFWAGQGNQDIAQQDKGFTT